MSTAQQSEVITLDERDPFDYSEDEILAALRMILQPTFWCHRAVESVDIWRKRVRRRIALDITVPPAPVDGSDSQFRYLVPILTVRKGYYIDNLDVVDDTGKSLPVLNRRFHNFLAARAIGMKATQTIVRKSGLRETELTAAKINDLAAPYEAEIRQLTQVARANPDEAVKLCARFFQPPRPNPDVDGAFPHRSLIAPHESVLRDGQSDLAVLAEKLAKGFFLVAELQAKPGEHRILKLSFDADYMPLDRERQPRRRVFAGWLRELGIHQQPGFTGVALKLKEAQSYHFKMEAPSGYLVAEQGLVRPPTAGEAKQGIEGAVALALPDSDDSDYVYKELERLGSRSAHIYACIDDLERHYKDGNARLIDRVGVNVSFFPEPWGLTGQAMVVGAVSGALLLWAGPRLADMIRDPTAATAFALLLAAPASLSTLLLKWSPVGKGHIISAPLRARLLAALTAFLIFIVATSAVIMRAEYRAALAARADQQRGEQFLDAEGGNVGSGIFRDVLGTSSGAAPNLANVGSAPGALALREGRAPEGDGQSARGGPFGWIPWPPRPSVGFFAQASGVLLLAIAASCFLLWIQSVRRLTRSVRLRRAARHGESV